MRKCGYWLPGLVLLAGCGVEGNWELRDVDPPEAIAHFDMTAVTFKPDNTYVARLRKSDCTEISRGTYDYDDWTRQLTMRSYGVERNYKTTLLFGLQMRIEDTTPAGKPMIAVLARSNQVVTPQTPTGSPAR